MSLNTYRLRLMVGAAVATLGVVNALALWGGRAAQRGEAALQLGVGLAAVCCGLIAARRVGGVARWWRLFFVAALALFLAAQVLWWWGRAAQGGVVATIAVVAYVICPVFAVAGTMLMVGAGGGFRRRSELSLRHFAATTVLDGVIAGLSFVILVALGGLGGAPQRSLPRTDNVTAQLAFATTQLFIVVAAVVITMLYPKDRPFRANYLLMAGGIVGMAAGDRIIAYLHSVGVEHADLWGGLGLIFGLAMIGMALLQPPASGSEPDAYGVDWAQLLLPYIGFSGTAVLFGFHVLRGRPLTPFVVCAGVAMVLLMVVRQVLAVRGQHLLTQRLYWTQLTLAHQVHHDLLTGLPNRLLFAQRLDEAMRDGGFVLILIDLDDFKEVNDCFGHAAGDALLYAVGERLRRCVSDADTLARIGGDEFAILIEGPSVQPDVVADRLRVALRDPFPVHGTSVRIRASMGLVVRGAQDESPQTSDDLLRQADISMYAGKRLGKDTAVVYQPGARVPADFPAALREASGGVPAGFSLAYQPVVRLPTGTPVAVEALARWTAPNGVRIAPETFVAAAEAAGLGAALDGLVLELACRELATAGLTLDIHVNVGAARLANSGFDQYVAQTLARHDIAPGRLVIEITETLPIVDLRCAATQIERLNALGVRVALDDFGAGYNSLTYLHLLPVQVVKLDRSLAVASEPHRDLALYRSVIRLCDSLGVVVVAEGIESTSQAATVYNAGGRLAQGHLYGSAAPIGELVADLADMVRGGRRIPSSS